MLHLTPFGIASAALVLLPAAASAQSPTPHVHTEQPAARAKVREACAAEIEKLCADIERAKGAMRSCLEANERQLSDGCRAARAEREAARSKGRT